MGESEQDSGVERVKKNTAPKDAVFQYAIGMAIGGISSSGNIGRPCSSPQAPLNLISREENDGSADSGISTR